MSGTITMQPDPLPEPLVSGLLVLAEQRTVQLLKVDGRRCWRGLSVGREECSHVWLPHPTVSECHARIEFSPPAPGTLPPAFEIRDEGSKNGIYVSYLGPRGPFARASKIRLEVGRHVRVGAVVLAVLDWASTYPVMTAGDVDYVRFVREIYGSDWRAAWYLGFSVERLRQVLAR